MRKELASCAVRTAVPSVVLPPKVSPHRAPVAASPDTTQRIAPRGTRSMTSAPRRGGIPETAFPTGGGQDGTQNLPARAMKYVLGLAAAGYLCDKAANGFFLSTTSLHDGRGGFTSNARLDKAFTEAAAYRQRFHAAEPGERALQPRLPAFLKRCGNRQFVSMTDYRAATKVHLIERTDTPEARASLLKSLECLQGTLVKQECVDRYAPSSVPADFDLRNSALYGQKSKYALAGVSNTETGARGYTSRSITRPFVNRGLRHFKEDSERRGLSLRESSESLQAQLAKEGALSGTAQFAAGQTLLNFRQVYASDEHWGHAENVIMKFLVEQGLLSQRQTERIDESLMFEDPSKSVFKRNTGVAGPLLHRLETRFKEFLLRDDPEGLEDIRPMALSKNMENLAIAHFKLNERGDGFEDCSGLGDSFTAANAVACINHARLMSGEPRLSMQDVEVLIACLNAVYDDASGSRHTLQEIARGCFAGAGYTIEDADAFFEGICREAAQEFYTGKQLAKAGLPGRPA
ncbi:type III effector HopG1 [Paracidovorax citrulli]